ncbi:MAG: GNAT family N-acetyltransferase, partial [Thermoplasmata archaeon]
MRSTVDGSGRPESRVPLEVDYITNPEEVDGLRFQDLSDFFNPFLAHFMREVLRCGGQVAVSRSGHEVDGLFLHNDVEKIASVFARSVPLATALSQLISGVGVFSELELQSGGEPFRILELDLADWEPHGHFRHPVRTIREEDRTAVARLLVEQFGPVDPRWLGSMPPAGEKGFAVEVAGQIAGVGWVSLVNGQGRLHSLSVRPGYRRLGVGTDLWQARVLWS